MMRCLAGCLFLMWAVGCVANNNYVHNTDTQDAQTRASYQQSALNAQREAAMGALLGHMNTMSRNMNAARQQPAPNPQYAGAKPQSSGGTPSFDQLMARIQQQVSAGQPGGVDALKQLGPEVQLLTDFVQAVQTGDMSQANSLIRDASRKFVKDPKQLAVIDQMTQLVETVVKNQGATHGISATGGFTAPGRSSGGFTAPAAAPTGGFSAARSSETNARYAPAAPSETKVPVGPPPRAGSSGATFEVGPAPRDLPAQGRLALFEPQDRRTYQDLELSVEARTDGVPAGTYQLLLQFNGLIERALWCRVAQDGDNALFRGLVPVPLGTLELCAWIPELADIEPVRLIIHVAEKPTGFQEDRLLQDLERDLNRARARLDTADAAARPQCLQTLVQAQRKLADQHSRFCRPAAARLLHEELLALLEPGGAAYQQAERNLAEILYLEGDLEPLLDLMTRHAEQAQDAARAYGLLAEWLLVLGTDPSEARPYFDKAQDQAEGDNCRILFGE